MDKQNLHDYRKDYTKLNLNERDTFENPLLQFQKWFELADNHAEIAEPNVMTLSTLGEDLFPKSRILLLKKYSEQGFVFFTNYHSEKGKSIELHSKVGLNFFWHPLERQVVIKGIASKVSEQESDEYFSMRPKASQLGAWASNQSQVVESREALEARMEEFEVRYKDKAVPRPKHWGGYIVKPVEYEFWQGRTGRLHDRLRYSLSQENQWTTERLAP